MHPHLLSLGKPLDHIPPLTKRNPKRNDTPHKPFHLCNPLLEKKTGLFPTISFGEVNLSLGDVILYLRELGPSPRKTTLTGETCHSPAFSLREVKLYAIFFLRGKNLRGTILSSSRNLLLFRGTTLSPYPLLRNLPSALSLGKAGLLTFFLRMVTFPTTLSFKGVNLPLGEKAMFLEEHSLNMPASFFLGVVNLPR